MGRYNKFTDTEQCVCGVDKNGDMVRIDDYVRTSDIASGKFSFIGKVTGISVCGGSTIFTVIDGDDYFDFDSNFICLVND